MKITFGKSKLGKTPVMISTLVVGHISKNIGWAGSPTCVYTKADSGSTGSYKSSTLNGIKTKLLSNLKPSPFELKIIEEIKKYS